MLRSISLFIALLFATSILAQDLNFSTKQKLFDNPIYGLLDFPFIPYDYNKDGLFDFVGRVGGEDLVVYTDQGSGLEPIVIESNDPYSRPFESVDFDGDGFDDLVLAGYIYLFDSATGEYNFLEFIDSEMNQHTIVGVADFDGNGFKDVLTIFDSGSLLTGLTIFYWDGENFDSVPFDDDLELGSIRVGDLEGDGDYDIAYINKNSEESPIILVNDGQGNFESRLVFGYTILRNRTLDFEDFDNDGDLDLLVVNYSSEMRIYENTDNFILPPFQYKVASGSNPVATRVEDLNDDGKLEIISFEFKDFLKFELNVYQADQNFEYSLTSRLSSFDAPPGFTSFNPNYYKNTIGVADNESDGDLDIFISYTLDENPSVWLFENYNKGLTSNKDLTVEQLSIFPNPVTTNLSVALPENISSEAEYSIINLLGQVVQTGKFDAVMDVSLLKSGSYYLNVEDGERRWISKFSVTE